MLILLTDAEAKLSSAILSSCASIEVSGDMDSACAASCSVGLSFGAADIGSKLVS